MELSPCCGAATTYHDDTLCCKVCWNEVTPMLRVTVIGHCNGKQYATCCTVPTIELAYVRLGQRYYTLRFERVEVLGPNLKPLEVKTDGE
jgi:hypothetical protein